MVAGEEAILLPALGPWLHHHFDHMDHDHMDDHAHDHHDDNDVHHPDDHNNYTDISH